MRSAERTTTEPRAVGSVLVFLALLAATIIAGWPVFLSVLGAGLCEAGSCDGTTPGNLRIMATAVLAAVTFVAFVGALTQARTRLRSPRPGGRTPGGPRSGSG
jgi:hypothetical protein